MDDVALSSYNKKLRELDRDIERLRLENEELQRRIRENNAAIEKNERIAESYRVIIAYEGGQVDSLDSLATDAKPETATEAATDRSQERKPSEMIRPQYQGTILSEVISRIFAAEPTRRFQVNEMVELVYDTHDDTEFARARNTMGAALSRGLPKGLWKGENGVYYLREDDYASILLN